MKTGPQPRVDREFHDWYGHRADHVLNKEAAKGVWRVQKVVQ